MKQIVIATDGSAASVDAVDFGVALAVDEGAAVTFVHVVPADEWVGGRGAPMQPLPHHVPVDETEDALGQAARAAETSGVSYSLERIAGEPVQEILAVADAKNADLIVVGSSRGVVSSALFGSVSRAVVSHAKRPVLVVKGARVEAVA
jgi:nucleotide-binding universal stress UspA family protein